MNLSDIAGAATGFLQTVVTASIQRSTGFTTNADGSRTPTYTTFSISCNVQSLTYTDLLKLDALNIQGIRRAMYVSADVEGLIRVSNKGGDIVTFPSGTFPDGNVWLAAQVLEHWPNWSKICLTLQDR